MRRLIVLLLALLAASCAAPSVYSPEDREGGDATGTITPLATVLREAGGESIRLVFVHGVGDHCRGYALDPKTGWLSDASAAQLGLEPKDRQGDHYQAIKVPVFVDGSRNDASYVEIDKRAFWLRLGHKPPVSVEAIEITWSHTTQWLKSNYLGYDSPSTTKRETGDPKDCVVPEAREVPYIKRPPRRLVLDRVIKEQVFDRNLADAIIYSGSYGEVIERAFAEALCRSLVDTPVDRACAWEDVDLEADASRRYFFVTHSLGSRVVYDAMLDLIGASSPGRPNRLGDKWPKSRPVVRQILADTPAFYMMANQLALLGLANARTTARADEWPQPLYVDPGPRPDIDAAGRAKPAVRFDLATIGACDNPLLAIAQARAQIVRSMKRSEDVALRVVAFNDTNDLLTWHVPLWYARGRKGCDPKVELTNVFVRNATPLVIGELPTDAHANYFRNPQVLQAIVCGANDGKLIECRR